MDAHQEREIACGLQQGKPAAWHALYDAYARSVWQSVARLMGPRQSDVADVVQETFLAAARSARGYDASRGSLWCWLCGIARRQVALHFRREDRQGRLHHDDAQAAAGRQQIARWLDDRQPAPADALASAELAALVRNTLSELPEDYETLLVAKYFDGASLQQIAGLENSTAGAVRSKLARARQAFRAAFQRGPQCSSGSCGRSPS
jgi:RNA polymerase sigma-70 factor, ECF subfamily